jgi:VCBS repeat-containing protein
VISQRHRRRSKLGHGTTQQGRRLQLESLEERRLLATASVTHVFRDDAFTLDARFNYSLMQPTYRDSISNGQVAVNGHVYWESPTLGQITYDGTATGAGSDQRFINNQWQGCSNYTLSDEGTLDMTVNAAQKTLAVTQARPFLTTYTQYTDVAGGTCPAGTPDSVYFGGFTSKYTGTADFNALTASLSYSDSSQGVSVTTPSTAIKWEETAAADVILFLAGDNGTGVTPAGWVNIPQGVTNPLSDVLDSQNGRVDIGIQMIGKSPKTPLAGPETPIANLQLVWASDQTSNAQTQLIPIDSSTGLYGVYWNTSFAQAIVDDLPAPPSWARFVKATVVPTGFTDADSSNNFAYLPIQQFDAQSAVSGPQSEDAVLDRTASGSLLGAGDLAQYPSVGVLAYAPTSRLGAQVTVVNDRGGFRFDPTAATSLQALAAGETIDDFIDFLAIKDDTFVDFAAHRVTVTGVNDSPTAVHDFVTVREDAVVDVLSATLLSNDFDVDHGDTPRIVSVDTTSARGATVTFSNGVVRYDPRASSQLKTLTTGQTLNDTVGYRIVDNSGLGVFGTVTVTVTGVNDLPEVLSAPPVVLASGAASGATTVQIRDWETSANLLGLAVSPQTSPLVDVGDVVVSGTGASRTVTISPNAGQTGRARLTARVTTPAPESALGTRDFFLVVGGAADVDLDGVPSAIESTAPSGGDANQDGVADDRQPHIASFRNVAADRWLRIDAPTSAALANVAAVAAPTASGSATGATFPWGGESYQAVVAPGSTTTLRFFGESTSTLNSFFQWTNTGGVAWDWLAWNGVTGAKTYADRVELVVQDGGRGDSDGLANGIIVGQAAAAVVANPWHNPVLQEDVDNDGRVVPLDGLQVINYLNSDQSRTLPTTVPAGGSLPLYLDVSPDNQITPRDALLVINVLNGVVNGEGEGRERGGNGQETSDAISGSVDAVLTLWEAASTLEANGSAQPQARNARRASRGPGVIRDDASQMLNLVPTRRSTLSNVTALVDTHQSPTSESAGPEQLDSLWAELGDFDS